MILKIAVLTSLLFIALVLSSCSNTTSSVSSYTLSENQMANILTELHIAEGATVQFPKKQKDSLTKYYYKQVFEMQHINEQEFQNNFSLLKNDPKTLEKLYKMVSDSIESRKKY